MTPLLDEPTLVRLRRLRLAAEKVRGGALRGERRSHQLGQGLEFGAHRPYTHGDDLRRVDWNVYGRLDQLFLKLFETPGQLRLILALDDSPTLDFGENNKAVAARRVLAAMGVIGVATAERVALARFGSPQLQSFEGGNSESRLIEAAAALGLSPSPQQPSAPLMEALATRGRDTVLIIASDLQRHDGVLNLLRQARRHGVRAFVIAVSAREELDPTLDGFTRLQPICHDNQKLRIDDKLLAAYREEVTAYRRAAAHAVRELSAAIIEVDSADAVEPLAMELMRAGGLAPAPGA
ncbi:MAG: DUF58 domain-containing protein [Planctomycetes bacterium]|nr:DUF58 domain-containing protein [Planctomycetota bacterium]